MIIGLSGKARSGKDTLADFAVKDGWIKLSFAKVLKDKVKSDFSLSEAHVNGAYKEDACDELNGHSPRELMIDYGNFFRRYDPNYWVRHVLSIVLEDPTKDYIITDVRFPNEAEVIRNYGGFLVRLERHPSRDSMVSDSTKQSPSETALDSFTKWDFHLPVELNETPSQLGSFWNVVKAVISARV